MSDEKPAAIPKVGDACRHGNIVGNGYPTCLYCTIEGLEAENAALLIKIEQHRGALGYPVRGDILEDPTIRCEMCDAKGRYNAALKDKLRIAINTLSSMVKEAGG
jgi:hypothetical protein